MSNFDTIAESAGLDVVLACCTRCSEKTHTRFYCAIPSFQPGTVTLAGGKSYLSRVCLSAL